MSRVDNFNEAMADIFDHMDQEEHRLKAEISELEKQLERLSERRENIDQRKERT